MHNMEDLLRCADTLLGNDSERNNYTSAVIK
jgi:hypothetical protein